MPERTPENTLPRHVEARKLVATAARFNRSIAASDLSRVAACCNSIKSVSADVSFGRDEQGRPTLMGDLEAELVLQCQRCLGDLAWSISKSVELKLVWDELEAKALPRHAEPWIVGDGEADLIEILEEELLLELPLVPKHDHDCIEQTVPSDDLKNMNRQNPFGVLADLKSKI